MGDLELRAFEIEFNRPITKRERTMINIADKVYLGRFIRPGWKGELDFYLFKCNVHGLVTSHPHGYNPTLRCSVCLKEIRKESESVICKEELDSLRKELRSMEKQ